METRAHHVLIGAFTIAVVLAAMLFALWLAKASMSRQYDNYDIIFTQAVTGLSQGGTVQYNGIRVGEVIELKLDPNDPRRVLVRIRVAAGTPVKTDTRARLALTGLTGVAFIQLTGGSPDTPLLKQASAQDVPRIEADVSSLSKLLDGSQDVVSRLNDIITRASELLSSDNVQHISRVLANLGDTTDAVADQRKDLGRLIAQLAEASGKLNQTLDEVNKLAHTGNRMLQRDGAQMLSSANDAMQSIERAAQQLDSLLAANRGALQGGIEGIGQLGPALQDLRTTLQSLQGLTRRLERDPASYLLGGNRPQEYTPQ